MGKNLKINFFAQVHSLDKNILGCTFCVSTLMLQLKNTGHIMA